MSALIRRAGLVALLAGFLATATSPALGSTGFGGLSGGAGDSSAGGLAGGSGEIATTVGAAVQGGPQAAGEAAADPCQWVLGSFAGYLVQDHRPTQRVDPDGVRSTLYARVCGGQIANWYWVRNVDPRQLAAAAFETARSSLPAPSARFSPDLAAGRAAVVHVPLRFGVAPAQWAPVSATADVPGLAATVTATPARLTFLPGDGSAGRTCAGPGDPAARTDAGASATPQPCSYTYTNASSVAPDGRSWPATLRISWNVAWTATDGQGGVLPAVTTEAGYPVRVEEIEALEQAGP